MALTFKHDDVLLARVDGFGAQYNQNLFAARSRAVGVTQAGVSAMTPKLAALGPQTARLFFNHAALADDDLLASFRKSVALAQQTLAPGGAINITLQALGPRVFKQCPDVIEQFAKELVRLRSTGVDKLRWVTLRNEPNGASPMDKQRYLRSYENLVHELGKANLQPRLQLMGGDLLLNNQAAWFEFMAARMAHLLDAYSIHVYWDYRTPTKIDDRLGGVRRIVNGLGDAKRPLYVMEYGARGIASADGEPGNTAAGQPVGQTNLNAFQRTWFAIASVCQGFRGTVAWDAYFAAYDLNKLQHYSLIGPPGDWARMPAFRALRLLVKAVRPGWKAVAVSGVPAGQRVAGFTDGAGQLTVVGLDTAGAQLNGGSAQQCTYTVAGLPANTAFNLWFWNHDGDGMNSFDGQARTDAEGCVTIAAPLQSVFALTTLPAP